MKLFKRKPTTPPEVIEETISIQKHNEELFNKGKESNDKLIKKLKENGFHIAVWQAAGGKNIKKGSA